VCSALPSTCACQPRFTMSQSACACTNTQQQEAACAGGREHTLTGKNMLWQARMTAQYCLVQNT
jgi:hypothetical protein